MDKMSMHTKDIAYEKRKMLEEVFPNIFTEIITGYDESGVPIVEPAIDSDALKQEIAYCVVSGADERYQFTWPGKKRAVLSANAPINKTLRPYMEESVEFKNTENIFIEGDNLDVLKLLQETYLEKIKAIYIDPPYNTGNDFIYDDDFAEDINFYIANSGQVDEDGNKLVKNFDGSGRFHTDWLNMMYSRLKLARNLLSDDGVILISIDDNEIDNITKMGKEVFGEANFVASLIWKSRQNKDNRNLSGVSIDHEYIVVFAKNASNRSFKGAERKVDGYKNPDNDPRGPWTSANMTGLLPEDQRPNCHYDLIHPETGINYGRPKMGWRYDKNTMSRLIKEDRIIWPESPDGRPRRKVFLAELNDSLPGFSSIVGNDIYTRNGTAEIEELLGGRYFDFPKPSELLLDLILQVTGEESIIMDFFSGSSSTAHAVMKANSIDNLRRKYIMVQLPEVIDEKSIAYKKGFTNICEVGKERIRKARELFKQNNIDTGFRVLKLDSSNMKDVYYNPSDIEQTLFDLYADNIKEDRTPEDLLFQVMLDLGVLLSSKIEENEIAGKKVFNVADGFLMACFDKDVTEETVKAVAQKKPYYAVFRDSSMANDSVATNFEQIFATISPDTIRKVL